MNFDLTDEQRILRDTVADFAARELRRHADDWDRAGAFLIPITPKLAAMGLLGMTIPEAHGGTARSAANLAIVIERLGWGEASDEVRAALLPRLASGEVWRASCLTEPHAGSDAARLSMRAERRGDGYAMCGTKSFVTQGSIGGI